jgi:antitoxin component of MazEF toxin-antitoxin module
VVDLSVSKGKIVAVPLGRKKVTLRELLAKVSQRNLHGEVDTGRLGSRFGSSASSKV